jgi:hypothetical protein
MTGTQPIAEANDTTPMDVTSATVFGRKRHNPEENITQTNQNSQSELDSNQSYLLADAVKNSFDVLIHKLSDIIGKPSTSV